MRCGVCCVVCDADPCCAETSLAGEHTTGAGTEQDWSTDYWVENDAVRGLPTSAADTGASECHHWRAVYIWRVCQIIRGEKSSQTVATLTDIFNNIFLMFSSSSSVISRLATDRISLCILLLFFFFFFFFLLGPCSSNKSLRPLHFELDLDEIWQDLWYDVILSRWRPQLLSEARWYSSYRRVTSLARCMSYSSWSILHLYLL